MTNIISIDPGGAHIGVVWYESHPQSPSFLVCNEWSFDDFVALMHRDGFHSTYFDTIIYEGFRIRDLEALKGERPLVVELIGAIRLAWAFDHPHLVEQLPPCKQGWPDDEIIRVVGWMPTSSHSRDAFRHLLHYYASNDDHKSIEELRNVKVFGPVRRAASLRGTTTSPSHPNHSTDNSR